MNTVWVKLGTDENLFSQETNLCANQSQSSGAVDQILFASCMTTKGWHLESQPESLQQAVASDSPSVNPLKETLDALVREKEKRCQNPELESFSPKTACDPTDVTPQRISDKASVSSEEKSIILKLREEIKKSQACAVETYRNHGGDNSERSAQVLESRQIFNDKNVMDLYEGQQTWGAFDQRRKELCLQLKDVLSR